MSIPRAILLDLDNTLYPYQTAHQAAHQLMVETLCRHTSIQPSDAESAISHAKQMVKSRLGAVAASHHRLLYIQTALEQLGLRSQVVLSLELEQIYWHCFLRSMVLFEGAYNWLDQCRLWGIPIVIVTDLTVQIQFRKLAYLAIDPLIHYVVTSEEAGCEKPNPAPFELALHKLQLQPADTIMVGDNPATDGRGAIELGIPFFHKLDPHTVADQQASLGFYDYAQLTHWMTSQWNPI